MKLFAALTGPESGDIRGAVIRTARLRHSSSIKTSLFLRFVSWPSLHNDISPTI